MNLENEINQFVSKLNTIFANEYKITTSLPSYNNINDNNIYDNNINNINNDDPDKPLLRQRKSLLRNENNQYSPVALYPVVAQPLFQPPVIVNNNHIVHNHPNEKKSEKNESENKSNVFNQILGTVTIGGISVVATWIFSKDGYVTLWRSNLEGEIKELEKIEKYSLHTKDNDKLHNAIKLCNEWLSKYKERTKPSFYAKIGMTLAGIGIGSGLIASAPAVVIGSAIGGTVSGCYMLWNRLDPIKKYEVTKEINTYNQMLNEFHLASYKLLEQNQPQQAYLSLENHQSPYIDVLPNYHLSERIPSAPPE